MDEREILVADDDLGYRLRPDMVLPGLHTPYFTHPEIRTNSLGFRNTEVMIPKPSGVFRILSLGDSYAFGWGVKSEETYARRLEALLAERSAVTRVEVINAGVPSYASWKERQLLDQLLETLTPDLVICQVVDDDLGPSPARVKAYEQLVPRWIRIPLHHSRVFGMTWAFYYEGTSGVRSILEGDATRQRRLNREEIWDVMEASVTEVDSGLVYDRDRLASYVDDYAAMQTHSGRKLVVLILPNRYQIYAGGYLSAGYNWLSRALENESVPALNATRFLRKHRDTELFLDDGHPNTLAHTLIADTLAAFLIANGFLPPAPARVVGSPELPDSSRSP
jgi:lysophospholipase L1-like esterase